VSAPTNLAAIALSLGVALGACSSDSETPGDPAPTAPAATAAVTPTPDDGASRSDGPETEVPEVLDFEAPLLGGGSLRGETLAGRDVAFWFWAPW
jgi:hypothetical protein